MRITPVRLVTPALASIAVCAALTAAVRPLLTTPAPVAGTTFTTTANVMQATGWKSKDLLDMSSVVSVSATQVRAARPLTYTVRAGDTLSVIAKKIYGTAAAWYMLQQANRLPSDVITAGLVLRLPTARKTYPVPPPPPVVVTGTGQQQAASGPPASPGTYSYAGLESLWEQEGGSAGTAATAACIAEHESGGNPSADNGVDLGLWQIDPPNFPGDNLFSAAVNARDAVKLSGDGSNWSDWSTAPACGV